MKQKGFPGESDGKESTCNAGELGSIPGLERSPGEGNGNPFQYSCLGNPMDGEAWQATVHGVAKSRTRLSDFTCLLHLVDTEEIKNRWKEYTEELYKKDLNEPDCYNSVVSH